MRIIGGTFKGRQLKGKIFEARPTTDFAKESLFNILNNYFYFDQISILDLFAGSGSISFEFASRGCTSIDLVELNFNNYKSICDNIEYFGMKQIHPLKTDVYHFLANCKKQYNIIFADPPYDAEGITELPEFIFDKNLLKPEGWFILEHSKKYNFNQHPNFWQERKYGAVHFTFFLR